MRNEADEILAITICATDNYRYAMLPQARALHANLDGFAGKIVVILVGGVGINDIGKFYGKLFGDRAKIVTMADFRETPGAENYKNTAQLLIAQMRTVAFTAARQNGATLCWSMDSDVIPKTGNCFRTLRWMLEMPGAYYQIAISPYPSQGGGDLLAGRGEPENPIIQDFLETEREVPDDLKEQLAAHQKEVEALKGAQAPKELVAREQGLRKRIGECPPRGNVFKMNAESGWRRRGWMSNAYPGIGRGSIVPTDWCGFGNTLMTREALAECDFLGYDGGGTEDLYIIWNRWHQAGMRIGCAAHEPSNHVSRRKDGKLFVSTVRFVTDADKFKGEAVGHLRIIQRPFYAQEAGEKFDAMNDGNPTAPADRVAIAPEIAQAGNQPEKPKTGA